MRVLKTIVIVQGLLLVIGVAVLIALLVVRLAPSRQTAVAAFGAGTAAAAIDIPPGARVEALAAGPDRLVLDLLLPDGTRQLLILDLASGRRIGTIPLRAAP